MSRSAGGAVELGRGANSTGSAAGKASRACAINASDAKGSGAMAWRCTRSARWTLSATSWVLAEKAEPLRGSSEGGSANVACKPIVANNSAAQRRISVSEGKRPSIVTRLGGKG